MLAVHHSHLLDASPLSAGSLSPSHPCTLTIENQSHVIGCRIHLSISRVGVAGTINFPAHQHERSVVKAPHLSGDKSEKNGDLCHPSFVSCDTISSDRIGAASFQSALWLLLAPLAAGHPAHRTVPHEKTSSFREGGSSAAPLGGIKIRYQRNRNGIKQ